MTLKPDAEAIRQFIDEELRAAARLTADQAWWPDFIFHSSHVENIASVLNHGALLSRNRAGSHLKMDCASPTIIGGLSLDDMDWVRLYFGPMAPTQYANEGVRPKTKYEYGGAHMPVPVYLLFSSKAVLTLSDCQFTRGRLTRYSDRGADLAFLRSIPFHHVMHRGPFPRQSRDQIVDARHAEVLVKDSLSLDHLRVIVCRSNPERDTLLSLLDPPALARWRNRVALERVDRRLFYKRGTFVEAVDLNGDFSTFTLYSNLEYDFRGPFDIAAHWTGRDWSGSWSEGNYTVQGKRIRIRLGEESRTDYRVRFEIDGALVYQGDYEAGEAPELLQP